MIKLFSQLCKHFKRISSGNELDIVSSQIASINPEALACPSCGATHTLSPFASYERHLVTYDNGTTSDNLITIPRYICSSCDHTHAILPSIIIPYMSFSFKFTISIIYDYFVHKFHSVEALCQHYGIGISTFYRILKRFKEHKKLWLGLLDDALKSPLDFIRNIISSSFDEIEVFILSFCGRTNLSFMQGKA